MPPVTPEPSTPRALGAPGPSRRPLRTLLVTGDSMAQPLDTSSPGRLAGHGVRVIRDAHVGTGISKPVIAGLGQALGRADQAGPPATRSVFFLGANEGFPMQVPGAGTVACCGVGWATEYANRVRRMMNTYRRAGGARVYWLTLPLPRDAARRIARAVVNAAIEVAASAYGAQVHVLDMAGPSRPVVATATR